jgi:N-acetylglucosaminyldiphosphoundecaprenol N-acetyl-beta-D-mannosaminyltransferase
VDVQEAVARCRAFLAQGGSHLICTPNSEMIMAARQHPELAAALARADLVIPDGMGVVWAGKILGSPLPGRVTGIDLFLALCQAAAREGWSIYLLGGKPGVAQEAAAKLAARFQGLKIAGCQHGYFAGREEPAVLSQIKRAAPEILAAGLGSPRQELWLEEHLPKLGVPLGLGIGGSFDVLSGQKKRAPQAVSKLGLEWAWRLAKEPSRLPRMTALPRFALAVLKERLGGGRDQ